LFGDRLKKLREQKGISQRELAKLIQLSSSAVAMYELDQRSPDKDTIVKIAHLFDCTTDYLLGISELPQSIEPSLINAVIKIPILGTIRAGLPILADENIDGYLDVPCSMRADYVMRVTGDSMIGAGILDGDYAICRLSDSPQTGQIIIALKDEGSKSEAALKYYFNDGVPKLKTANATYADLNYTQGYRCAGMMIGLIREDSLAYHTHKEHLVSNESKEWTEVIELATGAGIKPQHLKSHIDMLIEMGKRRSEN
jgi:repressor LexA